MTFDDHKEDVEEESNPNRSPEGATNAIREAILQAQVKRSRNRRVAAQGPQQSNAWDALKQRLVSARITEAFASPKFFMNGKKFTALRTLGEGGYSTVFEVRPGCNENVFFAIFYVNVLKFCKRFLEKSHLYICIFWYILPTVHFLRKQKFWNFR
jgi:hypothetical protein